MYERIQFCELIVKSSKEPQYFTLGVVITCMFYSLYMILYFLEILIVTEYDMDLFQLAYRSK